MTSLREQFLGHKAKTRDIKVADWETPIRVQEMTVGRKMAFFQILSDNIEAINNHEKEPEKYPFVKPIDEASLFVTFSIVDEDNNLVLTPDDVVNLTDLPMKVIEAIYFEARALSLMSAQVEEIIAEKKD